ncbi:MAG: pyridoxamine 5'-phosphate oxidase [Bacteroidetes bacterium]|nr:pyridoxamine 5'-phosphate oxidase [Bacteroidota bacterium]
MDKLERYIEQLREDFTSGAFSEKEANENPFSQFHQWLQQAVDAKVTEVQAMLLSTVSQDNKPSSRIVYLREFENNQFWFYTNYNSRKAQNLQSNPNASLTFFWSELERQIRIEGTIQRATAEQSDAYFNSRPYESKIGAWASNQSHLLKSREDLEEKINQLQKQFTPETIKRPEHWGGFVLTANYYEFWQGRQSRLHDRISYELKNNEWNISRMFP